MTKEEFNETCSAKAPPHLKSFVPKAVETVSGGIQDPFSNSKVPLVIRIAAALHGQNLQSENAVQSKAEALFALKINPLGIITSEELHKQILPDIEEIRLRFFGRKEPPYPEDMEKAAEWLENECQDDLKKIKNRPQPSLTEFKKLITVSLPRYLGRKNQRLPTHELKFSIEPLTIPYRDKDGLFNSKKIYKGTLLHRLSQEIRRISDETDLSQDSILAFILSGIKPYLPAVKMRSVIKKSNKVQVDFFRRLDHDEFLSLHNKINMSFSPRKKSIKNKSLEIYFLVSDLGDVPRKKKEEFWAKAAERWNGLHPKDKFRNPDCLRIAYQRILKKSRT